MFAVTGIHSSSRCQFCAATWSCYLLYRWAVHGGARRSALLVLVDSGYKTDSGEIQALTTLLSRTSCLRVHVFAYKAGVIFFFAATWSGIFLQIPSSYGLFRVEPGVPLFCFWLSVAKKHIRGRSSRLPCSAPGSGSLSPTMLYPPTKIGLHRNACISFAFLLRFLQSSCCGWRTYLLLSIIGLLSPGPGTLIPQALSPIQWRMCRINFHIFPSQASHGDHAPFVGSGTQNSCVLRFWTKKPLA